MTRRGRGLLRSHTSTSNRSAEYVLRHNLVTGLPLVVQSESDWWVYNEVFVDRDYDVAIDLAIGRGDVSSPLVVLDVGANVGYFTARLLDRALEASIDLNHLRVYLIEGSPTVFADLTERYGNMPIPAETVSLVHGLAGARGGSAEISETHFGARNTLMPEHNAGFAKEENTQRHDVGFIDLTTLVDPGAEIALLKCDIEGSEGALIETYAHDLLPRVRIAVIELHHKLCDVARCMAVLADAGLRPIVTPNRTSDTSLVVFQRE